jgi:GT2 family glycosyltransferase
VSVLAIIPVYKNYEQRDRCTLALQKQTPPVEVFIHDNTHENLGYTKACNRGLREAIARGFRFAMVINQDCYPGPDVAEKLIAFMDQHPRAALIGPMQVRADQPDEIVNAGGTRAFPFGAHRAGRRSRGDFSRAEQVSWVNGACVFARMDAVLDFGLMDESMFLIGSDSDWSLSARVRGWECWYHPAVVLHEGGVSTAWPSQEVTRIFHQDMSYWRRKWVGSVMYSQLDRPFGQPRFNGPTAMAIQAAIAEHSAGRLVPAEVIYRDVLELEPDNADALNLLGVIELQYGMAMTAHDLFSRAAQIRPLHAQFHTHLATALVQLARNDEAVKEFSEAVRLETSPQMLEKIASELSGLGAHEAAAAARAKAQPFPPQK